MGDYQLSCTNTLTGSALLIPERQIIHEPVAISRGMASISSGPKENLTVNLILCACTG